MVYIWIRTTLDWDDEGAFLAQLPPHLKDPVTLWNSNFSLPYHLFRHRLKQVSQISFSRVEGAVCADWENIPEGALVVPVDDDDWFAPTMATTLTQEQESGIVAYYWPNRFLEVPLHLRHQVGRMRRGLFPATPPRFLCSTNNYAMVKSSEVKPLLDDHVQASHWFDANRGTSVKKISAPLSLMNRTLGSTTALDRKRAPFARSKMLLAFYRYLYVYRREAPPDLAWSQPYREMMAALMREL